MRKSRKVIRRLPVSNPASSIAATRGLSRLRLLGKGLITTSEASAYLGQTVPAASRMLARLADAGLIRRIRHGLWSLESEVDPLVLPEYLTAPYPAYVSFQSALQIHGMVSQIPQVIYVASLAPTRRIKTRFGTYSIHRLAPTFFGGFETLEKGVRLARPEKALLDVLYLAPARSRLFAELPEVEIPSGFNKRELSYWLAKVPPGPRRRAMEKKLSRILKSGSSGARSVRKPVSILRGRGLPGASSGRPRGSSRGSRSSGSRRAAGRPARNAR